MQTDKGIPRKLLVVALTSAAAVAGLVWSTSVAVPPQLDARPGKRTGLDGGHEEGPVRTSAACLNPVGPCCQPCLYFEDFDNAFFVPGPINGQGDPADVFDTWATGCGGTLVAANIDTAHPASGTQHLRLSYDAALATKTALGCVVSARTPTNTNSQNNTPPITVTTVDCDVAITTPYTSDFNVQPQARAQAGLTTRTLFFYYGGLYVLDDTGGGITFVNIGTWDTTGGYQTLSVTTNPCTGTVHYDYGNGAAVYNGLLIATTNVDQFLVYHDNFGPEDAYDVDNIRITRDPNPCPCVCGDGFICTPYEQCDFFGEDANCPGRCDPQTCLCETPCGGGVPGDPCQACDIVNDVAYTEITSGGWFKFVASAPAYAFETCGVTSYDSALSVWSGDCNSLTLIETNDDCDDNSFGFGLNADPLASCYTPGGIPSPYPSCLCVDGLTLGDTYYVSDDRSDNVAGRTIHLLASKRATCSAIWGDRGACCDSNGPDAGCTDDVAGVDCQGSDKRFTKNKSCGSVEAGACDCISNCAGRQCGDDGCGGSCGTCDDNISCTSDVCNTAGQCVNTPSNAACDDGAYCNGAETCSANGCVPGTNPCVGEAVCDEATDICAVPNPVIPTVSEWGLAILSLSLLVGTKLYFGRRAARTA